MAGRIARWGLAPVLGAVWWWAVLRLALTPHAGALEGAVAAGDGVESPPRALHAEGAGCGGGGCGAVAGGLAGVGGGLVWWR